MKKQCLLALALACFSLCALSAQESQQSKQLTKKEKNEIINSLLKNLNEIYIFPEVAKKAETKIREYQKNGTYAKINDPKVLSKTLTSQLREIVKDKHLSIWYRSVQNDTISQQKKERDRQRFISRVNRNFSKLDILEGNIGYIKIDGFGPADKVGAVCSGAMAFLANTDALIIDLRENHGGEPEMVQYLASYFFEGAPVHLNDLYFRKDNKTTEYWTIPVPGQHYVNKPVYVLISEHTFSAGEELAYDLQTQKRATLIGEITGGGANPGDQVEIAPGFYAFIPNGRAINPITKTNWEGIGVTPDISKDAADALKAAHFLALQKLIDTAPDEEYKGYYKKNLEAVQKK